MTIAVTPDARYVCRRCGQVTTPRGPSAPRFCAICGNPLGAAGRLVRHRFAPPYRPALGGLLALLLGFVALFVPVAGVVIGVCAIRLARPVRRSRRTPGYGLATLGAVFGLAAIVVHLMLFVFLATQRM